MSKSISGLKKLIGKNQLKKISSHHIYQRLSIGIYIYIKWFWRYFQLQFLSLKQ
ncbi:unnamed protein product (macronuclear) [Paramecium tetraurelia]|uniref:Uncharacterized protein n=1 Tax=Paramecium tetraurelia TaxID=5888 RepID=A0E5T5_PARTE|nr:uncharacterized protein GSPATT00003514001 [Paramecium tetraurelia]CAK90652.1 unnamed protein product [Paramecium tetraurelia]|eukprot:XP_001458049.1 hypothetical protein (macronuclear) [Paramecium tetraurelia strain d4-2]